MRKKIDKNSGRKLRVHRLRTAAWSIVAAGAVMISSMSVAMPVSAETLSLTGLTQEAEDAGTAAGSDESEAEILGNTVDAYAENIAITETIHIASEEDFQELVRNAHVDTWSKDKLVVLDTDLMLTAEDTESIASFGGHFDGQGHTISGLRITGDHASTGLFGTLQSSAVVENLTVKGIVTPSGIQSKLGGIAGINYGTIRNCRFDGTVSADNELGGIAGRNANGGNIADCHVTGVISGSTYCGGITGYNEGTVKECSNEAQVNTTYKDSPVTVDQLTSTLENIQLTGRINSSENIEAKSDTGGIAGYSAGNILSCTNRGTIGYEHVGYNVGGIVGRSSGLVRGCRNTGSVYGRKDVGGIAGQLQPDLTLSFQQTTLDELDSQIDQLNALVNQGIDNADLYATDTLNHLTNINGLAGIAQDSTKALADEGADRYDAAAEKLNTATETMQKSLRSLSDVTMQLDGYLSNVSGAISSMNGSLEGYLNGLALSEEDKNAFRSYWNDFKAGYEKAESGAEDLAKVLKDGPEISDDNKNRIKEDLAQIRDGYTQMQAAVSGMKNLLSQSGEEESELYQELTEEEEALRKISDKIAEGEGLYESIKDGTQSKVLDHVTTGDLTETLSDVAKQQAELTEKLPLSQERLEQLIEEMELSEEDGDALRSAFESYQDAREDIGDASADLTGLIGETYLDRDQMAEYLPKLQDPAERLRNGLTAQNKAVQRMSGIVEKYAQNAANVSGLAESIKNAGNTINNYPNIASKLSSAMNDIAGLDLSINKISDTVRNNGNNLYESMNQLTGEMQALQNSLQSESDAGADNLRAIVNQFDAIISTMQNGLDEAQNALSSDNDTVEDISDESLSGISDLSDEEIRETVRGRTTGNVNLGRVEADTNVGGISGMIGVEYDLDPEKDITTIGDESLDYIFQAKCIADSNVNYGTIKARSNYLGGIVGHMEMGLIAACENYGRVEGEGNYVGGIAGYSTAVLRENAAKAELSGEKYVGGIAGYGVTLKDNTAMVQISDYKQYKGAVAGRVKNIDSAKISGNYYYSENLYGIDDVSYTGIAEGITYESLSSGMGVPSSFDEIVLNFVVDGESVATLTCSYGGSIADEDLPTIPEKEGFYSYWSREDFSYITEDEFIEAIYERTVTMLSGGDKRVGGLSIIEVEGAFRKEDRLITEVMAADQEDDEKWRILIPDDGEELHVIRFLPPDDEKKTVIYVEENGIKKEVMTKQVGKYLTFEVSGDDIVFHVMAGEKSDRKYVIITAAAVAGGAVLLLLVRLKRIRRKKEKAHRRNRTADRG